MNVANSNPEAGWLGCSRTASSGGPVRSSSIPGCTIQAGTGARQRHQRRRQRRAGLLEDQARFESTRRHHAAENQRPDAHDAPAYVDRADQTFAVTETTAAVSSGQPWTARVKRIACWSYALHYPKRWLAE